MANTKEKELSFEESLEKLEEIVKKWNVFLESGSVYVNLNLKNDSLIYKGKRPETTLFWKNNHILFKLATRSGLKLCSIDELEKLPKYINV